GRRRPARPPKRCDDAPRPNPRRRRRPAVGRGGAGSPAHRVGL
ncbi:MAG: hypothetical protein AVDCRST_MAG73-735, partial [uncultured Thermomicrobiales bacterium]